MSSKTVFTLSLALVLFLVLLGQSPQSSSLVSAASFGNGFERSQMFDLEDDDTFGDQRPKRDEDWLNGGGSSGGGIRGGSNGVGGIGAGTLINEREPRETNVRRPLIFKRETNVRKPLLFKRSYASSINDFDQLQEPGKRISGSPLSRHWNRRPRPAGRPTILYV